jgi:hypothetical protein
LAGDDQAAVASSVMADPSRPDEAHPAPPADRGAEPLDDHVDVLPADLDASGYVGPYTFPDIARRRIPGYLYLAIATGCFALWALRRDDSVLVNDGFLAAAVALLAWAAYTFAAGWRLRITETDALVAATAAVGFPVGHASAQLGFRGLRSRPTWRILLYSAEEPPAQRGLVLVDGVDGEVLEHFVEDNPEDWSELA